MPKQWALGHVVHPFQLSNHVTKVKRQVRVHDDERDQGNQKPRCDYGYKNHAGNAPAEECVALLGRPGQKGVDDVQVGAKV